VGSPGNALLPEQLTARPSVARSPQVAPDSQDRDAFFGLTVLKLDAMAAVARGDDSKRIQILKAWWGDRLSEHWIRFKAARWRACADPEAVAGYVAMFARDGLPDPTASIAVPLLAVTGEHDTEIMRREAVTKLLAPLCERLVVTPLADCGHYPMQEAPPLLVTIVERFLAADAANVGA
jgi:pimeloyl-ACP methyl ester carboxylesterase